VWSGSRRGETGRDGGAGFQIIQRLGAGSAGTVYLAWHEGLNRRVALKFLSRRDPRAIERFLREGRCLARLNHPNILKIFDMGVFNAHQVAGLGLSRSNADMPYLVLEYVEGVDLDVYLDRHGSIPQSRALKMFREVLEALSHAHSLGVIHRDIKGRNILIDENTALKLADFGLARAFAPEAPFTMPGTIMGSPYSMSPEQARGDDTDHRTDIYSAGTVLFRMLTGRLVFDHAEAAKILQLHIMARPPRVTDLVPTIDPRLFTSGHVQTQIDRENLDPNMASPISVLGVSLMASR